MGIKNKDIVLVLGLAILCGAIIWHVFAWNSAGKYDEMYLWLEEGKAYLTVLYNLALMVGFGLLTGLLMSKITELISGKNKKDK